MRIPCLSILVLFCCALSQLSAQEKIYLWPKGAPGSEARMNEAEVVTGSNVTNVHHPSITAYVPSAEKSTGTAIIIAPGGGHKKLCLGHEGDALGKWYAQNGIAAFVLRYRLSREPNSPYDLHKHAMADTRRAIRLVRHRAKEWHINPSRVGIVGFSAGGELAAYSAMKSDNGDSSASDPIEKQGSRPDFQGLIYPGKSATFTVEKGMPPCFIAFGYHDREDIAFGMAKVYLKYKEAKVPCEMHIYSNAGHGFGFREGSKSAAGEWPKRMIEWLVDSKLLTKK
ncbi:MAG: alpha/beta hydrolase [Lentisphaeraceae bacterium]|nr:alpha/beta hydrolase [Lentisphaeraceae bacterium]